MIYKYSVKSKKNRKNEKNKVIIKVNYQLF